MTVVGVVLKPSVLLVLFILLLGRLVGGIGNGYLLRDALVAIVAGVRLFLARPERVIRFREVSRMRFSPLSSISTFLGLAVTPVVDDCRLLQPWKGISIPHTGQKIELCCLLELEPVHVEPGGTILRQVATHFT